MKEYESPFQVTPDQNYNHHDDPNYSQTTTGGMHQVIVPPGPPEFRPAAARALIRLLIAVHRRRQLTADRHTEDQ